MILYPTETQYALGVNAFNDAEVLRLEKFKGRTKDKKSSVLVRNINDIEKWGILSEKARLVAEKFLPGPLTLIVPLRPGLSAHVIPPDYTLGFRISSDTVAMNTIHNFIETYNAPLTCTSANVSGFEVESNPKAILEQFTKMNKDTKEISKIIEDGKRVGTASTVIKVVHDYVEIIREGAISTNDIYKI